MMPPKQPFSAVVIGGSAGAIEALSGILPALPAAYPMPIIVVIHIPPDKKSVMASLFQAKCGLAVKEAEDKEPLCPGTVYFAPPDYHLQVETNHTLSLSSDEPVLYSRPSIDVLFETAADAYGPELIGIVVSGANHDGAAGLQMICAAGGTALVQAPELAYATAMPEAALAACASAVALTPPQIAAYLQKLASP